MSGAVDELPGGWSLTTLGEVFKWGSGGTPKSTVSAYYHGDIPWAVIGDLNDGMLWETKRTITAEGLHDSTAKMASSGSLLVAMYGSIGKLAIAGRALATNQAIAFARTFPIDVRYVFWYLLSRRRDLSLLGKGGTQQNISQTVLKAFPFVVAPLQEQPRIVAAIEEHLSRLDAAVAALERMREELPRYRAAVLKAACYGKLVET